MASCDRVSIEDISGAATVHSVLTNFIDIPVNEFW